MHQVEIEKLKEALGTSGFLILRNSSITSAIVNDLLRTYKSFFSLPVEVKQKVDMATSISNRGWGHAGAERVNDSANPDYKEFFDRGISLPEGDPLTDIRYYAPNIWPDIPHFKDTLDEYFAIAHNVSNQLMSCIAYCMGQNRDYFESSFSTAPMSLLRGLFYPPRPPWATERDYGIAPHTDYGCLTLVVSDGTPGLEVQLPDGNWLAVTPEQPGDIVVNFGDMLQMWSDGQVKATVHRVRGTKKERLSSAFFFNPNYDTDVSPVLNLNAAADVRVEGSSLQKSPVRTLRAGDYLSSRYDSTYVHLVVDD